MKYKGLKPINENFKPKGIYSKTAITIFEEFLKTPQKKAIADVDATEDEIKSLYNAMKGILRRNKKYKSKIDVSIDMQNKRIILWKIA